MKGRTPPPRADYHILSPGPGGSRIGTVASGTQSPTLGEGIGMGYVPVPFSQPETPLEIEIRTSQFPAVVVKKPFYKRSQLP